MFHLSMGMFQQGCYMLDKLTTKLNETNFDFRDGLIGDTVKVLSSLGIHRDGLDIVETNVPKVVNLSSRR